MSQAVNQTNFQQTIQGCTNLFPAPEVQKTLEASKAQGNCSALAPQQGVTSKFAGCRTLWRSRQIDHITSLSVKLLCTVLRPCKLRCNSLGLQNSTLLFKEITQLCGLLPCRICSFCGGSCSLGRSIIAFKRLAAICRVLFDCSGVPVQHEFGCSGLQERQYERLAS